MSRKCDSQKYKKRKLREHLNSVGRKERIKREDAEWRRKHREAQELKRAAWLANPRRQLERRLVNILYAKLNKDPFYTMLRIGQAMGVNISFVYEEPADFALPPGAESTPQEGTHEV